ncbi:glycoside hydrolase family 2 protein [Waltera intestinalis]|uniref:Glycoside hydrolase family 2 protein n=1 Tax=Waltera intestinalis TaxID=2606635 RepID=A0A6L5YJE2_9FIRM|nr:glycoside hydrolase family 2 TIM barrel-domain containing protein [Waltera intestinalis]MST57777.1 glycoside hydrolase family 2 protein [Waltera intestinalis]
MTHRLYLNDDWLFTEQFEDSLVTPEYPENTLQPVRLPHTCKETPFHYFDESLYQMVSGYRRHLLIPKDWQGKRILLIFEGAAHDSTVFCNGKKVGEHHCGYTAFTVDLTDNVLYGQDNLLCVRLDSRENLNVPPFGYVIDYMTYGGIYRDVRLEVKEKVSLSDIFVHTAIDFRSSPVTAQITSELTLTESDENVTIRQYYMPKSTAAAQESWRLLCEQTVSTDVSCDKEFSLTATITAPLLWDTEEANLYILKTQLYQDNTLLDETETTFGIREAVFKKDGFYLNGRKLRIRGLNRHQSFPYVGYAMPKSMQRLDADLLKKELGLNAVRTSHYPQSHYFLERCDELGLLVFTEFPGWQHIGDDSWKAQAVANAEDMIRQYRNHPSIILWGIRINESPDDDAFYEKTNAVAHKLDPSRPTGGVRAMKKSHLLEDVYTYNDFLHDGEMPGCDPKKKVTSDMEKPYLISEYNGHMYPTKAFDNEERRSEHAIRHANVLDAVAGQPDIAGSFGWCMFDYNTHKDFGSGDRICYHGVMDMFRNPKLAANIYACEQEQSPVLEITSSMDIGEHPGCNRGNIYILSNADSVKMYKNDRFIKEYLPEMSPYKHLKHGPILIDDFIGDSFAQNERFRPKHAKEITDAMNLVARGSLNHIPKRLYLTALKLLLIYHIDFAEVTRLYTKYIGDWGGTATIYRFDAIKDGKVVKSVTKEPVREIRLEAEADHTILTEQHSYDVSLVRIRAVDDHGNVLPFYQEPVRLITEGDISIIGPDTIALQGGMGGTYVKSTGRSGRGALLLQSQTAGEIRIPFQIMI